ncbi:hypothetical protein JFU18_28630 [Bacillus sp. TH22]|uniref:Uncharacterized protein n=2 Tax=Bacillus cereus group TaxID=86661 RepID=A0A1S9TGT5_BACCE|nr:MULTISPECIES: hypothetical protein [Bacillus]ARJ25450.1 hypothetical protein B7492_30760 [Bacillus mycoides]MBK5424275.1 hypothetical protein [Bacillus sp. TH30]MBK5452409.1 hypothetical protein [Bacillus sp. TH22]MBK5457675.1 hypothetical protein [Bacillus sp. TH23]MBK5469108.1 hypothetical protein [Bacillus sp. TH19]
MSSACTCHIDKDKCLWCKTGVYCSTFESEKSQGVSMNFPDGKVIRFHTSNIEEVNNLADILDGVVVGIGVEEKNDEN